MRLEDFISHDLIIPSLTAQDKRGVLDEMVSDLAGKIEGLNRENLLELLLDREKLGSTGIGYGVAIPHARLDGLEHTVVSFGRSMKGIDFQSMDDKPAHLFFLIFAPGGATTVHIKVLARISQLLKDAAFRDRLMRAATREELYRIIVESDRRQKASV
ncbi:MAG: PTS sugar transporter subunit IIA [Thermodesulfobacteriota bacterium]